MDPSRPPASRGPGVRPADEVQVSSAPVWLSVIVTAIASMAIDPELWLIGAALGLGIGFALRGYVHRERTRAFEQARVQGLLLARVARLEDALAELQGRGATATPVDRATALREPAPAPLDARAIPRPEDAVAAPGAADADLARQGVAAAPSRPSAEEGTEPASAQPSPDATALPIAEAPSAGEPVAAARAFEPAPAPQPSAIELGIAAARAWLLGGNTVARVGLLIMFVGVSFLLRYVSERTQVPIELRLIGVAGTALAFLGLGWRLRERRPGFAITLQGGAVGLLYLTAFAAMRVYQVLDPLAAFVFLGVLSVLSGALSLLQDARALASLGAIGGFLAPILVSTGSGAIGLLYAYYLLLDAGVAAMARLRTWRELHWIGFTFTFGVSALWVADGYTPADYAVTQGFLIAFWLLFLGVSLQYAVRQLDAERPELHGRFDTTLVFALPLAAFGIQTRLTQGLELALAAVIAAAVYLAVSAWVLQQVRRGRTALGLLGEANFAVGVSLLTLAIPLASSAQWTAASWPLEGIALLWVGVRQRRALPLAAGVLLHVLGAFALVRALENGAISPAAEWSGFTVNLAVLTGTAFAAARLLEQAACSVPQLPSALRSPALAWIARAIAWSWVIALLWQPLAFPYYGLAWCALSLALIARESRGAAAAVQPSPEWVLGVAALLLAAIATQNPLPEGTAREWVLLLRLAVAATATAGSLLSLGSRDAFRRIAAGALLTLGLLVWLIALLIEVVARVGPSLAVVQISLVLCGATALALGWLGARLAWSWPQRLAWLYFAACPLFALFAIGAALLDSVPPSAYYGALAWPIAWSLFYGRLWLEERSALKNPARGKLHVLGLWLLTAMVGAELSHQASRIGAEGWSHGAWGIALAAGLWLPVQHAQRWPVRAAAEAYAQQALPVLALVTGGWLVLANLSSGGDPAPLPALPLLNPLDLASLAALAALVSWHLHGSGPARAICVRTALEAGAFAELTVLAVRAVHFTAGVPWDAEALARSFLVQATLSLLWTGSALVVMSMAHRWAQRRAWTAGAALLAIVVGKLFLVDLSARGTVERIVSFIGVGLLILLIGYLSPLPPSQEERSS